MEAPVMYSCGYNSSNGWKCHSIIDSTKRSTAENVAADIESRISEASREAKPYESIVFNAVQKNPGGCITEIYIDIISNGMFRLQYNKDFNEAYPANYHRSYAAVNDRPYIYGNNNLSPAPYLNDRNTLDTSPHKKGNCC